MDTGFFFPYSYQAKMTIIFSGIARGSVLLCSSQTGAGNFEDVMKSMLSNIPTSSDGKRTYTAHR